MSIDISQRMEWEKLSPRNSLLERRRTDVEKTSSQVDELNKKIVQLQDQLFAANKKGHELSEDAYGVMVEKLFKEEALEIIEDALERGIKIGIVFGDVDRLKDLNDSQGHNEGDELLQLTINTLKNTLRSTDIVMRKGDEFIALVMADWEGLDRVGVKIGDAVSKSYEDKGFQINSFSIGVCSISDLVKDNKYLKSNPEKILEEAIKIADERMYDNKRSKGVER